MPQWGSADGDYLSLAASVLSTGKSSRLYKRLVYDEQIASDVDASVELREIGGLFTHRGRRAARAWTRPRSSARSTRSWPASSPADPPRSSCQRVKTLARAGFIRGVERIGGFGGKSDVLAKGEVFAGRPDFYKVQMQRVAGATRGAGAARPRRAGSRTASTRSTVEPVPGLRRGDRRAWTGATLPDGRRRRPRPSSPRSSGPRCRTASRSCSPSGGRSRWCSFDLLLDAGYAADQFAQPGTASLAMSMLDEGTTTRSALQISDRLAELGATLGAGVAARRVERVARRAARAARSRARALRRRRCCTRPSGRPTSSGSGSSAWSRSSARRPTRSAWRCGCFPRVVFGEGHAYANPWSGSGTEASAKKITRDDLVKFHGTWFKPNHATMVVVGATTMAEIRPKLERLFAGWRPGDVPAKNIAEVRPARRRQVYLLDRPGAEQTTLIAGNVAPPKANPGRAGHRDDERGAGQRLRLPAQHEPARGQALVVRRVQLHPRRPRAAAVPRARAGADRQDQGGDRRAAEGAARASCATGRSSPTSWSAPRRRSR